MKTSNTTSFTILSKIAADQTVVKLSGSREIQVKQLRDFVSQIPQKKLVKTLTPIFGKDTREIIGDMKKLRWDLPLISKIDKSAKVAKAAKEVEKVSKGEKLDVSNLRDVSKKDTQDLRVSLGQDTHEEFLDLIKKEVKISQNVLDTFKSKAGITCKWREVNVSDYKGDQLGFIRSGLAEHQHLIRLESWLQDTNLLNKVLNKFINKMFKSNGVLVRLSLAPEEFEVVQSLMRLGLLKMKKQKAKKGGNSFNVYMLVNKDSIYTELLNTKSVLAPFSRNDRATSLSIPTVVGRSICSSGNRLQYTQQEGDISSIVLDHLNKQTQMFANIISPEEIADLILNIEEGEELEDWKVINKIIFIETLKEFDKGDYYEFNLQRYKDAISRIYSQSETLARAGTKKLRKAAIVPEYDLSVLDKEFAMLYIAEELLENKGGTGFKDEPVKPLLRDEAIKLFKEKKGNTLDKLIKNMPEGSIKQRIEKWYINELYTSIESGKCRVLMELDFSNQNLLIMALSAGTPDDVNNVLGKNSREDFRTTVLGAHMDKYLSEFLEEDVYVFRHKLRIKYPVMLLGYQSGRKGIKEGEFIFDEDSGIVIEEDERYPLNKTALELIEFFGEDRFESLIDEESSVVDAVSNHLFRLLKSAIREEAEFIDIYINTINSKVAAHMASIETSSQAKQYFVTEYKIASGEHIKSEESCKIDTSCINLTMPDGERVQVDFMDSVEDAFTTRDINSLDKEGKYLPRKVSHRFKQAMSRKYKAFQVRGTHAIDAYMLRYIVSWFASKDAFIDTIHDGFITRLCDLQFLIDAARRSVLVTLNEQPMNSMLKQLSMNKDVFKRSKTSLNKIESLIKDSEYIIYL
jgi:hypothetical protein